MARFRRQSKHKQLPASILLEAVIAAVIAMGTLAAIAEVFNRQFELIRRARDTDLLEAVVRKDINAIRQFSRLHLISSGPFSDQHIDRLNPANPGLYTGNQTVQTYSPINAIYCRDKQRLNNFFLADMKNMKSSGIVDLAIPYFIGIPETITPDGIKDRYKLTRLLQTVTSTSTEFVPSLRITYNLEPIGKAEALAFKRTAEIQIQYMNGC